MIIRQKVVALSSDIGKEEYSPTGDGYDEKIDHPKRDPVTGAKRTSDAIEPWTK